MSLSCAWENLKWLKTAVSSHADSLGFHLPTFLYTCLWDLYRYKRGERIYVFLPALKDVIWTIQPQLVFSEAVPVPGDNPHSMLPTVSRGTTSLVQCRSKECCPCVCGLSKATGALFLEIRATVAFNVICNTVSNAKGHSSIVMVFGVNKYILDMREDLKIWTKKYPKYQHDWDHCCLPFSCFHGDGPQLYLNLTSPSFLTLRWETIQ